MRNRIENIFLLALFCVSSFALGSEDPFLAARNFVEQGEYLEADKALQALKEPLNSVDNSLRLFTRGVLAYEQEKYDESKEYLNKALSIPSPLEYYIRYYLGRTLQAQREFKLARREYLGLLKLRPPSQLTYETKFQLSEMSIAEADWRAAFPELVYLEKRWRSDENYPEILWRLIKVEFKRKRKWRACYWARRLYSKYPQHPLVDDWGIDLPSSPFEGKKIGCLVSPGDQQKRIRRLQWAGKSDRARSELEILRSRAEGESAIYAVDFMMAKFLVNEGFVEEALKILLKHYEKHKKSFTLLMLLAKAASRAGEYQTAVGAYHQAHESNPKSRSGREALFQAAFLSYQFQDYDGASRKFELFIKKYPRSGLSRDSQWHLSWIRYLKGDYQGALEGFDQILGKKKSRRNRRYWSKFSVDKINYWKAMALLRMGKKKEAEKIFSIVIKDPLWDYYTFAAKYRLASLAGSEIASSNSNEMPNGLPGIMPDGNSSSSSEIESMSEGNIQQSSANKEKESGDSSNQLNRSVATKSKSENSDSEQNGELDETQESESEEELTTEADVDTGESEGEDEDGTNANNEESKLTGEEEKEVVATDFKDPNLRLRFERATLLMRVGLLDWARWELYEIERRTRNPEYLKMLMTAYEKMKSYHRASYISIVNFAKVRSRYGIEGVRYLWEHAYPQAFSSLVNKYSTDFNVPKEFIWGIMRSESSFRQEVVSPVGAKGLMQIMPNTAAQVARLMGDLSFNERFLIKPEVNIRIGTRYLQRLLSKFEGSVPLAAAGYNAGPHRVESWLASFGKLEMDEFIEHIPFIETRNYVKKVVRTYGIYENLYNNATTQLTWLIQPIKVQFSRPSSRETWETL
ncbi:MAG: transglycosylase SLT domain-containing protein [Bdellovibrionales bacterium]|nr:transglycosylase SLT domain-containing protein [Bdellovibrionales bacterium]